MKARIYANVVKAIAAAVAIVLSCTAWALEWNDGTYTWSYVENTDGTVSLSKSILEAAISPNPTGAFEIPSKINGKTLKEISTSAFRDCTGMTAVTIPASVTDIGGYAFANCTGLKTVVIPSGVTSIGSYAFFGCNVLDYVTVPDSVTGISDGAFSDCGGLHYAVVPEMFGSDSEKTRIFGSTTAIIKARDVKVEIVDGIGLAYTVSDGEATVGGGASNYAIPKDTAGAVTIPATLGGCPVTAIGECAFMHCIGLTSVTIPSGVTSIDEDAFRGCSGLASVTIPSGVTSIGSYAFYSCDVLDYVTVPDSVTSIGNDAFADCAGLNEVVVPAKFGSELEKIFGSLSTYIEVRDVKVEIVDGVAWAYTVSDGEATVGGGANGNAVPPSTAGAVTIPATLGGCPVTTIRNHAFYGCAGLTDVVIPSSVTSIGGYAFSDCSGLSNVTVPDSVTIEDYAFKYCAGLKSAVVPTAFGTDYAKWLIFGETTAVINARDVKVEIVDGVAWAFMVSDGEATVGGGASDYAIPKDTAGAVTIPATLGGCPVTTIRSHAFGGCAGLTDVVIPSSVTSIGGYAFFSCDALTSMTIPDGVTSIGEGAFSYCSGLTTVTIPSGVANIGSYAFYGCNVLDYVTVPDSVTAIEEYAFFSCAGLNHAVVPTAFGSDSEMTRIFGSTSAAIDARNVKVDVVDGVVWAYTVSDGDATVGGGADDRAIPKDTAGAVTIPATLGGCSVTAIGQYVFAYCDGLASVTIPSGVTSIGKGAFRGCMGLTTVAIPSSVTSIEGNAFWGCNSLATVHVEQGDADRVRYLLGGSGYSTDSLEFVEDLTTKYTVTFYGGGKTLGTATVETGKNTNQAAASAYKPTREGYVLTGWYDANGKIMFDAQGRAANGEYWNGSYVKGTSSATWKYAGNVTAYAYWKAASSKYTVTFYGGGKTLGTATVEKGKNTSQAAASLYKPTRDGYVLDYWGDANGKIMFDAQGRAANGEYWNGSYVKGTSSATWKYAGNVTAYVYWKAASSQKYTVTFYGGGKTLGTATVEKGKNTYQAAASAYKPTRDGYVLSGWYDASGKIMFDAQGRAANGTYWNGSYVPGKSSATWKYAGNVTAYARWAQASVKHVVTFYGGGKTLGTATVETGKNTCQAAASAYKPTRAGYVLSGWYDANDNILFDAQGRAANGMYWNGSYVKGSSSATWIYEGNVTAYAHWAPVANANAAARKPLNVVTVPEDDGEDLFEPGEFSGAFADGEGTFALMLDEGLETGYLVTWTDDGGIACECEAAVVGDMLVLTTEDDEVYNFVWEDDGLVATRVE